MKTTAPTRPAEIVSAAAAGLAASRRPSPAHPPVKVLTHLLAGVTGAALASLVAYQFFNDNAPPPAAPPAIVRPLAAPPPPPPPGPTVADLERAARENADLAAQLAETRERLARHGADLAETRASLEELRRPMTADILSSALRAELKSGEAVVTGGYPLADGTRLYAFVRPVVEERDGETTIRIDSLFRILDDPAGAAVGLDNLATNAANTLQHGEVWIADELDTVLGTLDATPGTNGLSLPDVAVLPGQSATIELGELRLKVTPDLAADGETLDFEVRLEQSRPPPTATPPPDAPPPEPAPTPDGHTPPAPDDDAAHPA